MGLTVRAYAKVNLALEVLGPRPDGYHDIVSVLQSVSLWDTLSFRPDDGIHLTCNLAELETEDNLAVKAARLLQEATGCSDGVSITLSKGIPVAAGLGGGSSDAAATLRSLNVLWGLGLAREELASLGASLGSDVPFFVYGGTALAEGRGEKVNPLPDIPETWLLLVLPTLEIPRKTEAMYKLLNPRSYSDGVATYALASAVKRGEGVSPNRIGNVFTSVVADTYPPVAELVELLRALGLRATLSGTGPTLYALVDSREVGEEALQDVRRRGVEAHLVHSVSGTEAVDLGGRPFDHTLRARPADGTLAERRSPDRSGQDRPFDYAQDRD
ncbi:MAG: 4-(cytidine 5'-diphospho)-2-C-methyl-D-erythritol kinase [Dehalococcoidia bacterium]|nr:4-(cytidine 5'-diphospho)-2-C-methyl-D-erythritol kinase [Dehalococcoidia bacterium]